MKWLENEVAVVTGAGSGIGKAVVHRFVEEGAKVVAEHLVRFPSEAIIDVIEPETVGTMGGEFEDLDVGYHVVIEGRDFADDGSCTCVSLECIS